MGCVLPSYASRYTWCSVTLWFWELTWLGVGHSRACGKLLPTNYRPLAHCNVTDVLFCVKRKFNGTWNSCNTMAFWDVIPFNIKFAMTITTDLASKLPPTIHTYIYILFAGVYIDRFFVYYSFGIHSTSSTSIRSPTTRYRPPCRWLHRIHRLSIHHIQHRTLHLQPSSRHPPICTR